jgi:hypothetical protein
MNQSANNPSVARVLAPEDVRVGQFVALFTRTDEHYDSALFSCSAAGPRKVRIHWLADEGSKPLRVEGVCIPFVLVRTPKGKAKMLDLRRDGLVRLDPRFAWRAFRALGASGKKASEKDD